MIESASSSPLAQDPDHRIRWFGAFQSPLWEKHYRSDELPDGTKIVRIFAGIMIAAYLAFLVNDYRFLGTSVAMGWMLALRGLIIVGSLVALGLIRPGMNPGRFDAIVVGWTMALKIIMLGIAATRPAGFVGHAIVILMSILLTYWIVPVPLIWRAITAWFLTAGALVLGFWVNPWPDAATATAVTLSLILANIMGGEMCREQQVRRRRQFLALWQQQELSASLERALSEIKTLSGILPICMHCKRIADDAGGWEPIEAYVHRHSHAQFTHGLCPDCARSQYPEINWEESQRQREQKGKSNSPGS